MTVMPGICRSLEAYVRDVKTRNTDNLIKMHHDWRPTWVTGDMVSLLLRVPGGVQTTRCGMRHR